MSTVWHCHFFLCVDTDENRNPRQRKQCQRNQENEPREKRNVEIGKYKRGEKRRPRLGRVVLSCVYRFQGRIVLQPCRLDRKRGLPENKTLGAHVSSFHEQILNADKPCQNASHFLSKPNLHNPALLHDNKFSCLVFQQRAPSALIMAAGSHDVRFEDT